VGAPAISEFTGLSIRQIYHQREALGVRHLGGMLIASKKELRKRLPGEAA